MALPVLLHLKGIRPWLCARLGPGVLAAGLLAQSACGGGGDPGPWTVELGTLDPSDPMAMRYVPLSEDAQVQLAGGAQGGFHIWTLYRISGNQTEQRVKVRRVIDRLGTDGTRRRILTADGSERIPAESPWQLLSPIPSFVCPTPLGVSALDAPVELKVRFEDNSTGALLGESAVRLRAVCPPAVAGDTQNAFCNMICVGK